MDSNYGCPTHGLEKMIKDDVGKSRLFCEFIPRAIVNAKLYPLEKLSSKEIYNIHIKSKIKFPTAQSHLMRMFQVEALPWTKIYTLS